VRDIPQYMDDSCQDLRVAYECVCRMASLYASMASLPNEIIQADVVFALSETILEDLGRVHQIWKKAGSLGGEWRIGTSDKRPLRRVYAQQIRRLDIIIRNLSDSHPGEKWLRVIALCEARWIYSLERLARVGIDTKGLLNDALSSAKGRQKILRDLMQEKKMPPQETFSNQRRKRA